jgi:pantoate--beta-alanine ligase
MQRLARSWRVRSVPVALVPTMGYLHHGHLSLVRIAREKVGLKGIVVVSIYVNPTQFGPAEDFSRYPRDLKRDAALSRAAGVDLIFAPSDKEMYPSGETTAHSTFVVEETLSKGMEGKSRPTHFRGVTTVVAKLFNIVLPDFAVFGAKDYQQAAVVQRMVRDLNFSIKIVVAPTFREPDGLAMSSRNKYLHGTLRSQAVVLSRSLQYVKHALKNGAGLPAAVLKKDLKRFVERQPAAKLDYVEFFDPKTLAVHSRVSRGTHMALAVRIGKTRLIDNGRL